jgi:RNA polymerase sigma-70 factor, ECF subfamily
MVYSLVMECEDRPGVEAGSDDADLVRRIAASPAGRAQAAEAELYRRLAPRVRLYGLRHLRDEQAAADLTQQVLLITLEGLRAGRLREPSKLASFVLGTCRLVVLDLRRGAHRRDQLLEEFARGMPTVQHPPPDRFENESLAECLGNLPERERSVVVMTFYDEQTSEELTSFLGVSAANVRVIRHRALKRLRECLSSGGSAS